MSLFHDSALVGSSGQSTGYTISRSLRFNASDSAYLSRTPASAGNRKTWTWSGWVKRAGLGTFQTLLHSGPDSENATQLRFNSADTIKFEHQDTSVETGTLVTSQVFRDVSAWYHIVLACDTTQATDTNRLKLYVNGTQVTTFSSSTYPSQNADLDINTTTSHRMGGSILSTNYLSGYLADIHFIDGQALTPSSFTEVSATTGQLIPKAYSGSFGTNGFWLKFSDNSAATATTLGKDYSGNNNNWTPNNLSVTAGAGNDSLVDTPTSYGTDTGAGGEVRGNCATFNPLYTSLVLRNGNLDLSHTTNAWRTALSTIGVLSGKWYAEFTISGSTTNIIVGASANPTTTNNFLGDSSLGITFGYQGDQTLRATGVTAAAASLSPGFSSGATVSIAMDADAGKAWFAVNGTWINSGNPANGSGAAFTNIPSANIFAFGVSLYPADGNAVANFGQRPFAYPAPSGFKALCDTNLPAPVVAKPNQYFGVGLYTGNNGSNTITTGIDNTANAGLLWIKNRTTAVNHNIYDKVRGYSSLLELPTTAAEYSYSVSLAETSTGYTLNTGSAQFNASGSSYVAWNWAAGSSTVSNTQGSITSQVRANASAGFSIVTYTGNGTTGTVGHGLGVAPGMVIIKSRSDGTTNWTVWHSGLTNGYYIYLNTTGAQTNTSASQFFGNTSTTVNPSSSVITLGGANAVNNSSPATYVAYCFAPVAGYSSFGSYTGNGSADGPFVYTGMRARWILLKRTDANGDWILFDAARDPKNVCSLMLFPNTADAEFSSATYLIDVLSNGFKLRQTGPSINASSGSFVYAAFAENPFQYARAR